MSMCYTLMDESTQAGMLDQMVAFMTRLEAHIYNIYIPTIPLYWANIGFIISKKSIAYVLHRRSHFDYGAKVYFSANPLFCDRCVTVSDRCVLKSCFYFCKFSIIGRFIKKC